MGERRDILWRFLGDAKSLNRASQDAQRGLGKVEKGMGTAAKAAGALGLALGAREIGQFAYDAVQMAMAAEEVDSKFQAVYGSASDLNESLEEWGDLAGVTTTDAKNLAATFGNLAMAQGISEGTTKNLAMQVATLAGDMASFNDADPAQVFEDINKGMLTTEREGLKKYGIAVTEAEVKTRALAIATADGRDEITQADRAMASYEIIVSQAGKAVGDLERTQDSAANQQRQLKASMKELQELIGKQLLPAYQDLLQAAADLTPLMVDGARAIAGFGQELSTATGIIRTFTGESEQGFNDAAAGLGRLIWEQTKFIPGANMMDRALRELNIDLGILSDESKDAWAGVETLSYVVGQARNNPAIGDIAGEIDGVGDAAAIAESKVAALRREINLFDIAGSKAATEAAAADAARAAGAKAPGQTAGGGPLEGFHSGGMVPGVTGQNRLMMLQGGERIMPRGSGGGGETVVNINIGVAGDPYQTARTIADLLTQYEMANGTRISGVST